MSSSKPPPRFALIGAAGYIAPRHLEAIRAVGGRLVAAVDPFDSVGILDRYFPQAAFFTEFERFDRHLEKLKRRGERVDYVVVCSPNYLHDAHCRFGLRYGADVICEKPTVLNPWNVDALGDMERETGRSVYSVLQLRLHPQVAALRRQLRSTTSGAPTDVELTYITGRGSWYHSSWKGDTTKSGGLVSNIGIHFFDLLIFLFGRVIAAEVHVRHHDRIAGYLELERARVRWFLSINADTIPTEAATAAPRTYRFLQLGERAFDFSRGFTELHRAAYVAVLRGDGFGLAAVRPAIALAHTLRAAPRVTPTDAGRRHPLARLPLPPHPFERA